MQTKEIWDLAINGVTVLLAGAAAWKAFAEFKLSRIQRKEDLLWKQAEAAKAIIDDWMDDSKAYNFCKMIEYDNRAFKNEKDEEFNTDREFIISALGEDDEKSGQSKIELDRRYVRDCCDSFLYYTEMMNQGREGNLYLLKNLKFPLNYYLCRMQDKSIYEVFVKYAFENSYHGSLRLFKEIMR